MRTFVSIVSSLIVFIVTAKIVTAFLSVIVWTGFALLGGIAAGIVVTLLFRLTALPALWRALSSEEANR